MVTGASAERVAGGTKVGGMSALQTGFDLFSDRSIVASTTVGGISIHTGEQTGWETGRRPGR